jgi:hypothetical protein
MFTVEVRDRGNNIPRLADGLDFAVGAYSAAAVGGCEEATLTATGDRERLQGLLDWLGYPVTIRNEHGNAVWWGFVAAVDVNLGGITVGLDVETVRNRVSVAYTERAADGGQLRGTTAWVEDLPSQAQYGVHEERLSMGDITESVALGRRDAYLSMRKTPARTVAVGPGGGASSATLRCAGWWQMLNWRYWEQPGGMEEYAGKAGAEHVISFTLTSTEFGFKLPSSVVDILGRLHVLTAGTRINISGSISQDNVYMVKSPPRTPENDAVTYTSNQISFETEDDIFDLNDGLSPFESGDIIKVTGSAANNRYYRVNTAGSEHIQIKPKTISNAGVGPDVTIRRGHELTVEETFSQADYPAPPVTIYTIGTRVAQSFTPSANVAWNAYEIIIQARRIGAPSDDLTVAIWSDNVGIPGVPGVQLAAGTIAGSDLTEELASYLVTLSSPLALNFGTTYWVVVERTGSPDAQHMFAVGLDEGLGHSGALKVWKVDHWEDRVPNCDMPFEVWGKRETTAQISDMVGSVLPTVIIESPSAIYAHQWRAGDNTVRAEVEELLATGTSAGRRLLAQVSPERVARVFAEPDPEQLDTMLTMEGRLRLPLGALDEGQLPAGQWVQLEDNAQALGPLFIERAEYTPGTGYSVLEPRSSAPWEAWT